MSGKYGITLLCNLPTGEQIECRSWVAPEGRPLSEKDREFLKQMVSKHVDQVVDRLIEIEKEHGWEDPWRRLHPMFKPSESKKK